MKILGIDPGLATIGYGLVNQSETGQCQVLQGGIITTPAKLDLASRLQTIHQDFKTLIKELKPDSVAIEKLFFYRNITSCLQVAHARGVLMLICRQQKLPIFEYTPLQIKMSLTNYGKADKKQVWQMVKKMLNNPHLSQQDDQIDALATALTHINHS